MVQLVKNLPANVGDAGDSGLIPGLGRSLGEGNGNPLQYSCLENPMDRRSWHWAVRRDWAHTQNYLYLSTCKYLHPCSIMLNSCDSMDCSLPESFVLGIFQARILEWVAMPSSRGIFPTQGWKLHLTMPSVLLHCGQILYLLSHWGSSLL